TYNAGTPSLAMTVLELVDAMSVSRTEPTAAGTTAVRTDFRPVWCSLGMATGDFNDWDTNRTVPVVSYGAYSPDSEASTSGVLRVACPVGFPNTPPILDWEWTYFTGENPGAGESYSSVNGSGVSGSTLSELGTP